MDSFLKSALHAYMVIGVFETGIVTMLLVAFAGDSGPGPLSMFVIVGVLAFALVGLACVYLPYRVLFAFNRFPSHRLLVLAYVVALLAGPFSALIGLPVLFVLWLARSRHLRGSSLDSPQGSRATP
jgi:hypothetical protein